VNLISSRNQQLIGGSPKILRREHTKSFLFYIKVHIFEEINVLFDVISTAAPFEINTEEIIQTFLEKN
jgi:hypothetical protein